MPLMQWSPKLSVGIKAFDEEHTKLIAMLNDLFDAMQGGHGKEIMGKILDGLLTYTRTHFAHEERYMKQHGYPHFTTHKAEHDLLAKQVLDVQARYKAGNTSTLSMEVLGFIRNWLVNHIQGSDKGYTVFLNSKGVN